VRILIDECLPTRCHTWFPGHTVETVEFRSWKGVLNGALLARAVEAGFEVLLTADRRMYRQHDFSRLALAVVVTPGNRLNTLNELRDTIVAAIERAEPPRVYRRPRFLRDWGHHDEASITQIRP
jgi:hypothetical protein